MEKKQTISKEKLEAAAKVLGVSVKDIESFNEKAVFNNNIALEQGSGQTNHVYPVKDIIEYFKDELSKKDDLIAKLNKQIEMLSSQKTAVRKAKQNTAKGLRSVPSKTA